MDGVFVIIGVFEEISLSLNLKIISARRLTLNDSYCPLIDLMIFDAKVRK